MKEKNGFAATGILYTILLIFLVLMTTLLTTLASRSKILNKLKNNAKEENEISHGSKFVQVFDYTGDVKVLTIPYTGIYKLQVWGAQGGGSELSGNTNSGSGAHGGYSVGMINLKKGTKIYVFVGGAGQSSTTGIAAGGYNGGGAGYASSEAEPGNGGGGATDIRISSDSLYSRVIVAGGGGGGGEDASDCQGTGGGVTGVGCATSRSVQYDATQTSAGNGGTFGNGEDTNLGDGGGGGGGWYGGGTLSLSTTGSDTEGGGGGSGWIYTPSSFLQWQNGNAEDASNYLLDSQYYLSGAKTVAGSESIPTHNGDSTMTGNSGNGYAKIELLPSSVCGYSVGKTWTYNPGSSYEAAIPCTGSYKLEVWGAQGGSASSYIGGYGAYSVGEIFLIEGQKLYISVGDQGKSTSTSSSGTRIVGGFNGGGYGYQQNTYLYAAGGGGATHIATSTGKLAALSGKINSILIVAGAGAGGYSYGGGSWTGNHGGGYTGGYRTQPLLAGTQTSGFAFGQASDSLESYKTTSNHAGGGGGYYGGKSYWDGEAGGGSGYIGNFNLINKAMYMYCSSDCSKYSSTVESTKTNTTTNASDTPVSSYAKKGNGYAKITYLGS